MRTAKRHTPWLARAAGALLAYAAVALPSLPRNAVGSDAPPAASAGQASVPAARRQASPMMTEMLRVLEQRDRSLAEVQGRIKQASGERAALDLQREAERIKSDAEVALLRVQAGYARREGRLRVAQEIEAAIETLLHPPSPKAAVQGAPRAARPR